MNDSESALADQVQLLLKVVATQTETIQLQAETIYHLMGEGVEEGDPTLSTTFLDGTPR
ncbi:MULTISPECIES: hypothetical protein [unclassified Variovorax]|uniref:hypothetical protein n=1 Tax=unclassified Variovorax TaxID=663243 RepID=UPI002575C47E|nr:MULTISPECIES: hypothetical protein [unclassified Variovorax]MDM0090309.1 hypothetical protein [Variovorax sp. J22G40]MDM0148025.1 hypothetical protein [Variovorax sp. J2P1-31]